MGAAVAGQQASAWANVGAGQLQVAAALTGALAGAATINVAAITVPLELGFGEIGDDMVVEPAGGLQVSAATVGALRGVHIMLEERGVRWRFGPDGPGATPRPSR